MILGNPKRTNSRRQQILQYFSLDSFIYKYLFSKIPSFLLQKGMLHGKWAVESLCFMKTVFSEARPMMLVHDTTPVSLTSSTILCHLVHFCIGISRRMQRVCTEFVAFCKEEPFLFPELALTYVYNSFSLAKDSWELVTTGW